MAVRTLEQFPSLVAMFFARAAALGDRPFLWHKHEGAWQAISWRETAVQVASLATALRRIGLDRGDRVMLVSENRPEWCISDLAIMAAGCITVPAYVTNTVGDHTHIIENSGAKAIIVSSARLARTILPAAMRASAVQIVIGIDEIRVGQPGMLAFHRWQSLVSAHPAEPVDLSIVLERTDTACIIYTSGTGGAPRGVMQHHGAILHNVEGCCAIIAEDFGWDDEVFLSFLPLSHAYEHTGGQFFPIGLGAQIYYAEGLDKLSSNLEETRPTIMVVVPRLFEVLRTRITKTIERQGGIAPRLLQRALAVGARRYEGNQRVLDPPLDWLLGLTIKPRVRQRFGGRVKAMVSGGAPLTPEVGIFFQSLGLTLLQGYGQTECAPVICCNRPSRGIRMDSVGPPLKNTRVRIADDGEILVAGELVMHGYWANDAETARVLQEGWLHTGDIGIIDGDGRIRITDRKKDIIVNDKGDNVAPQKVEGMLTLQPEIIQAMIVGDRRPYLVAVIVPDPEWAQECNFAHRPDDRGALDPALRSGVAAAVDRVNAELSVTERIRRFILADAAFAIDNEQLTPSLKIRRHVIGAVYGARIDALYRS